MGRRRIANRLFSAVRRAFSESPAKCRPKGGYFAEPLERRTYFATLVINGGSGNDDITVSFDDTFIFDSTSIFPHLRSDYDAVQINGNGGNDQIIVENTRTEPVDVYPGTGNDWIILCLQSQTLDSLSARVWVHAGSDTIQD